MHKTLLITFIVSLICTGIFHEFYSCAFAIVLIVYLMFVMKKKGKLVFWDNEISRAMVVLLLFYLISMLWAVDRGVAWLGIMKNLPCILFLIAIMQVEGFREKLCKILPYISAVITIIGVVLMQIPTLSSYYNVAGRLAGFFQYPNTYALFLLVSELLLIERKKNSKWDYVTIIVLLAGIFLTGSRTVFVLAILTHGVLVLHTKNKRNIIVGISLIVLVVLGLAGYTILQEGADVITRLFRISFSESTFLGRFLYFSDAIPVILKHPFGLGYMGYYYLQQSIQTGMYSIKYIHNDFLQIMLDVGWIPCILFVVAIVKTICNKRTKFIHKLLLTTICVHSCFDFNLQFISMFWLLLIFTNYEAGKKRVFTKMPKALTVGMSVMIAICLYSGISLALAYVGKNEWSLKLFPWNTMVAETRLTEIEDLDDAENLADAILARNEYVSLAYSVKARQAYAEGDFLNVIYYKNLIFEKAPYQQEEYIEYCYMLITGIQLYVESGDMQSAEVCRQELLDVPNKLEDVKNKTSKLGRNIKDQFETKLPEDIVEVLAELERTKL